MMTALVKARGRDGRQLRIEQVPSGTRIDIRNEGIIRTREWNITGEINGQSRLRRKTE